MKDIIEQLIKKNRTISCMESCTGGYLANEITNVEGASKVFRLSYVTYCNDAKILIGVDEKLINKYSVYSIDVASDMAKVCSQTSNSDYGVGITGQLTNADDKVYVGIYEREQNKTYTYIIKAGIGKRQEKKERIIEFVEKELKKIMQ